MQPKTNCLQEVSEAAVVVAAIAEADVTVKAVAVADVLADAAKKLEL
jgi:hypothetical protein